LMFFVFFFFSSRRRHTRFSRDWSSDVCSSDLFESYAELRDLFRLLHDGGGVRVVVVDGAGGNFCSGGDVHEIIGPLTRMDEKGRSEERRVGKGCRSRGSE